MSQRNERSQQPESNGVTHWLIRRAAYRAPGSLSSRLEEEWLADLESRPSAWSRLRFATGCCWASLVIAHEAARNRAAATSAVSAGGVVTLNNRNFSYFSLRSATLFLIAGLHAALFYGMIVTLQNIRGSKPPKDLQYTVVKPEPPVARPPVGPVVKDWTITLPKLDPASPPPLPRIASDEIHAEYKEIPVVPGTPIPDTKPTHVVVRVAGGPGAGFPETSDFYPPRAIRAGEEGVSTVRVCVDPKGRIGSAPTIQTSSGFSLLDEAALKLARAGSGHYRANTEDGQPVNSCYAYGIRFQLNK